MRNYEERAKAFIEEIYPYIKTCKNYYDVSSALNEFLYNNPRRKIRMEYGSTRIALITSDYVVKFNYNGWGTGQWGNSADEVRMYRFAQKEGFAHLLAKITPVRKGYNRTFYIMPRIKGIGKTPYDVEEYLNDPEEYNWIVQNIGDRHNHNYGWENGHPVIIDYAYNRLMK